jgi:hypothetical protein
MLAVFSNLALWTAAQLREKDDVQRNKVYLFKYKLCYYLL